MKSLLWLFYRKQTSFLFVLISAGHSHTISGNVPILPAGSKKSVSTPSGSVQRCVIRTTPSGSVQKQISLLPKLIPRPDLPAHGRYSISSRNLKTWAFVLPWACLAARMGPVHVQDSKVFKPPQPLCHYNFVTMHTFYMIKMSQKKLQFSLPWSCVIKIWFRFCSIDSCYVVVLTQSDTDVDVLIIIGHKQDESLRYESIVANHSPRSQTLAALRPVAIKMILCYSSTLIILLPVACKGEEQE